MTTFDVRPAGPAADLSAARFAALTAEVERLSRENTELKRLTDDILDRESMHVYDADMERLTTAAEMDQHAAARAVHDRGALPQARWSFPSPQRTLPTPQRPQVPELERTGAWTPGIEWDGFGR